MNRLLVAGLVAAAAFVLLRHPAGAPPGITSVATPLPAQHRRKGHPSAPRGGVLVYVVGAVAHAGLYRLADGSRIDDAVRRAGGLAADADPTTVNLAERVSDGEEIHVLRSGETPPPRSRTRSTRARKSRRHVLPPGTQIDLNTADASALGSLPGIGPTLADRIVQYRELNGPFASVDELADVSGMTQSRVDAVAPYVTLHQSP